MTGSSASTAKYVKHFTKIVKLKSCIKKILTVWNKSNLKLSAFQTTLTSCVSHGGLPYKKDEGVGGVDDDENFEKNL